MEAKSVMMTENGILGVEDQAAERLSNPHGEPGTVNMDNEVQELPSDYEECGHCGFDHSYDYEHALAWHIENDPENNLYE